MFMYSTKCRCPVTIMSCPVRVLFPDLPMFFHCPVPVLSLSLSCYVTALSLYMPFLSLSCPCPDLVLSLSCSCPFPVPVPSLSLSCLWPTPCPVPSHVVCYTLLVCLLPKFLVPVQWTVPYHCPLLVCHGNYNTLFEKFAIIFATERLWLIYIFERSLHTSQQPRMCVAQEKNPFWYKKN
jgi:hypothetical protein